MKPWVGRKAGRLAVTVMALAASGVASVAAGPGSARASSGRASGTPGDQASRLLAPCALGTSTPGLGGEAATAVTRAAAAYGVSLTGASATERTTGERAFAAAAAAYLYGMPQEILRTTVKGYLHNAIVNVNALATPSTQGVVSPNVDTAYSVAWIDLTSGPLVFNVPDTGGHYYTVQFMDAYTNAFAYVGSGSTGTRAGAFAVVPPGWHGSLPHGLGEIRARRTRCGCSAAPSSTGRTTSPP